jgi:CRP-like cAMP-binding protein
LLGSEERSATVKATSEVKLGILTRAQVKRLAEKDPQLGYRIFYNIGIKIADNLRRANRDILKLATALCLALDGG